MAEARKRFVILHHAARDGEHWDFMLDTGEALATWRLSEHPQALADGRTVATHHIGDHRRDYLDYEGPVSKDRGQVRRVESGTWDRLDATSDAWTLRLQGALLDGTYRITPLAADQPGTIAPVPPGPPAVLVSSPD